MNAGELIQRLSEVPADTLVVVDGYEGGVTEVFAVDQARIQRCGNGGAWYYGEHETVREDDLARYPEEYAGKTILSVVHLNRHDDTRENPCSA